MESNKILIIENDSAVALDIFNQLELIQYQVVGVASSLLTALDVIEATPPNLILAGIRLSSSFDGVKIARRIREQYDIPIVYLAAYTDPQTWELAKATEPYGFIFQPFEAIELYTAVELALYKHATDRKLRERERWLSFTLRSIGDAVIITNEQLQVIFMNAMAENLTGWKQEESLNANLEQIFQIIDERTRLAISNPVAEALQRQEIVGIGNHALLITKTGAEIPIDDSAAPIVSQENEIQGAILVFHDIIERKQVELALRQRNDDLENQVQQRLEELRQRNE